MATPETVAHDIADASLTEQPADPVVSTPRTRTRRSQAPAAASSTKEIKIMTRKLSAHEAALKKAHDSKEKLKESIAQLKADNKDLAQKNKLLRTAFSRVSRIPK